MRGSTIDPSIDVRGEGSLPDWLETYVTVGLYGLVVGTLLCLFALVTNPIPDPSFPWYTLPDAYRLPVTQPRIEHWPVSYTVGIWLWIAFVPGVFIRGYQRWGTGRVGATGWLVAAPTAAMLALTTYCRLFWPKPDPATWNAPAYTFVCWAYCATYDPLWSNLAYAVALVGVVATVLATCRAPGATVVVGSFGVLALPLGLPALWAAIQRSRSRDGGRRAIAGGAGRSDGG